MKHTITRICVLAFIGGAWSFFQCDAIIPPILPRIHWETPVLMEVDRKVLDLAGNQAGDVMAVCTETGGSSARSIYANRYIRGGGWQGSEHIDGSADPAIQSYIAVNSTGNAVAVWIIPNGMNWNIWANRFAAGDGWQGAELIANNPGLAEHPRVAMDPAGNAFAVWALDDGSDWNIWANRYAVGDGWQGAELIENIPGDARELDIVVDPAGNAVVVWCQYSGMESSIYANCYSAGVGWQGAELIKDISGAAHEIHLAMDPAGNAIAIWLQWDNTAYDLWADYQEAGGNWQEAVLIETDLGDVCTPQIAMDPAGNAVAVWAQDDGTGMSTFDIWANHYLKDKGWQEAVHLEMTAEDAFSPQVAVDPGGNAIVMWTQTDGSSWRKTWAGCYVAGVGWTQAKVVSQNAIGDSDHPLVVFNDIGAILAVWYEGGSAGVAWFSRGQLR